MNTSQNLMDPNNYTKNRMICIDFDGTITDYADGWIDEATIGNKTAPLPGAFDALRDLVRDHTVVIWSVRGNTKAGQFAMRVWLSRRGLEDAVLDKLHFLPGKPPAIAFIDDRAITFNGTWTAGVLVKLIKTFAPWYRRK